MSGAYWGALLQCRKALLQLSGMLFHPRWSISSKTLAHHLCIYVTAQADLNGEQMSLKLAWHSSKQRITEPHQANSHKTGMLR